MSAADFAVEVDQFENHPKVIVGMNGRILAVDVGVECRKAFGLSCSQYLASRSKLDEHLAHGKRISAAVSNSALIRRL